MAKAALHRAEIVDSLFGPVVASPADEIVELIQDEADPARRIQFATAALGLDGACIEAYIVLAEQAQDSSEAALLLSKAVSAGNALWNPVIERRGEIDWWDFPGTRPYMRAIHALGQVLAELGEVERARECFEKLLDADPRDRLGVRFELARLDPGSPELQDLPRV